LVSLSRPIDINRAIVRAAGVRCSFSAFSARRPFGHDAQGSPEALSFETPPKPRAVSLAGNPRLIEPGEPRLQRTIPTAEDVAAVAAQD
jgi:hypothetical protein